MSNDSTILGYIHDGYTLPGYIAAAPRLYPALRFTFRPILSQNRAVIFRQIASANDPRREESLAAQAVKAQLVDWDLKDHKGEVVPIDVPSILRMQPRLMNRLFRVLMGDEAGDEDPNLSDGQRSDAAEAELVAALAGCTPEEAAAKNYSAG
jgi:hypothetical protein